MWELVEVADCWEWVGRKNNKGYGLISRMTSARHYGKAA